jgi:hypothetical protein
MMMMMENDEKHLISFCALSLFEKKNGNLNKGTVTKSCHGTKISLLLSLLQENTRHVALCSTLDSSVLKVCK